MAFLLALVRGPRVCLDRGGVGCQRSWLGRQGVRGSVTSPESTDNSSCSLPIAEGCSWMDLPLAGALERFPELDSGLLRLPVQRSPVLSVLWCEQVPKSC